MSYQHIQRFDIDTEPKGLTEFFDPSAFKVISIAQNTKSHRMFSTHLKKFLALSSNYKLSSANSLSLEESKICRLGKRLKRNLEKWKVCPEYFFVIDFLCQ